MMTKSVELLKSQNNTQLYKNLKIYKLHFTVSSSKTRKIKVRLIINYQQNINKSLIVNEKLFAHNALLKLFFASKLDYR